MACGNCQRVVAVTLDLVTSSIVAANSSGVTWAFGRSTGETQGNSIPPGLSPVWRLLTFTFTHVTACMLATCICGPLCTEGFSSFDISATASIATGLSEPVPGWVYARCEYRPFTVHPVACT